MKLSSPLAGFKLMELMFTVALIAIVGLVLCSILYTTTVLGAKNTADLVRKALLQQPG